MQVSKHLDTENNIQKHNKNFRGKTTVSQISSICPEMPSDPLALLGLILRIKEIISQFSMEMFLIGKMSEVRKQTNNHNGLTLLRKELIEVFSFFFAI